MHGQPKRRRPNSRATVFLTVASLVSITVLLVGIAWPAFSPRPRAVWCLGPELQPAPQLVEVTNGTPVALEIELPFPAFVYVASWSAAMGTVALFPSEQLSTAHDNPLPTGLHHLPGLHDGKPMTWPTPNVVGPIYYLAVASREPRPDLESALRRVRQMGHLGRLGHAFDDRGMYLFVPEAGLDDSLPLDAPAAPELDAARTVLASLAGQPGTGPMRELPDTPGVFARPFVVEGH